MVGVVGVSSRTGAGLPSPLHCKATYINYPQRQQATLVSPTCHWGSPLYGNGRTTASKMASKDESPKARNASPSGEHASPRKRRKVNHGGYDQTVLLNDS